MLENGFVKLHRSILKWEWYDDPKTLKLFIHLLLTAGIEDSRWHGVEIPKGSRVISFRSLAKELHFTEREIRTHLSRLEKTQEVTRQSYAEYSVITVSLWSEYQSVGHTKRHTNDTQTDTPATHDRQQYKKIKEDIRNKESAGARELSPGGESIEELQRRMRE